MSCVMTKPLWGFFFFKLTIDDELLFTEGLEQFNHLMHRFLTPIQNNPPRPGRALFCLCRRYRIITCGGERREKFQV